MWKTENHLERRAWNIGCHWGKFDVDEEARNVIASDKGVLWACQIKANAVNDWKRTNERISTHPFGMLCKIPVHRLITWIIAGESLTHFYDWITWWSRLTKSCFSFFHSNLWMEHKVINIFHRLNDENSRRREVRRSCRPWGKVFHRNSGTLSV